MALPLNIVAGVMIAGLAGSAAAQPDLYVAQYQFNNAKMEAVRVDGTNPRELFAIPAQYWLPIGLACVPAGGGQAARLVWMDSAGASEVHTAALNGGGFTTGAAVPGFCKGASLDGQGRVYFGSDNRVMRCNQDGTGLVTLYTSPTTTNPVGAPKVDATNGHVYFGDDGFIRRMNLDGSNLKVVLGGISQARSIALDIAGGHIYWADADTISDHIARAKLDGTERTILIDASPGVVQSPGLIDLVVSPQLGKIFYADELLHNVYSADLNGGNRAVLFATAGGAAPSGLALSTGEPVQAVQDCDGNGVPDDIDIAGGAPDCDNNGVIDTCQGNPCPARTFLLNQGSDAANSQGRALGEPSNWQAFQPFDVPADGWNIGEIGLDGFTVNYHDGSGFTARIFRDNGSGSAPDESTPLASARGNYLFNTNYENWVYLPVAVSLSAGRHWVRIESTSGAVYQGTINHGFSGLGAKSRGSSGNFTAVGRPIALRLVEGPPPCRADFNGDGFVDFFDADAFVECFEGGACPPGKDADVNGDGFVDFFDSDAFVEAFEAGC